MTRLAEITISDYFDSLLGQGNRTIGSLVGYFIQGAMIVAGILLLFLMIGGGISLIAGAGSGNKESMERGKQAVTSALIGFIIIFASYWVIRIIEIITGTDFITAPSF
jgi:hypothetical protein